jgi:glycosyltransferase involved in cell wall biosynthesis
MKILYNVGKFSGGAPLSMLQYMKIMRAESNEIIVTGEFFNNQKYFIDNNFEVINCPNFSTSNPFKNIYATYKLIRIVNTVKPEFIHATSYGIVPSKFVGLFFGIPVLVSIAGGKVSRSTLLLNNHLIVYSYENKFDLAQIGYDTDKIEVISNRIEFDNELACTNIYLKKTDTVKCLLISRLDFDLFESIKDLFQIIDSLLFIECKVHLTIMGDGTFKDELEKIASEINRKYDDEIIKFKGYIINPNQYIKDFHVVFGRGRSIIEAIANTRVSIILGDQGNLSVCNKDTFENLYFFNFSGRCIEKPIDLNMIYEIMNRIKNANFDYYYLDDIKVRIMELYDINNAKSRILEYYEIFKRLSEQEKKNRKFSAIKFYFKYQLSILINKDKWKKLINLIRSYIN